MYLSVVNVKPLEGYKLLLTFENSEERIFDVSPYLNRGRFSELKQLSLFNTVRITFDSIEWGNQLDLDPELLYLNSMKLKKVAHNQSLQRTGSSPPLNSVVSSAKKKQDREQAKN